jgi:hypothetical protein
VGRQDRDRFVDSAFFGKQFGQLPYGVPIAGVGAGTQLVDSTLRGEQFG